MLVFNRFSFFGFLVYRMVYGLEEVFICNFLVLFLFMMVVVNVYELIFKLFFGVLGFFIKINIVFFFRDVCGW